MGNPKSNKKISKSSKSPKKQIELKIEERTCEYLVDVIKGKEKDIYKNLAFEELIVRLKLKIFFIVNQFYIPGLDKYDIMQEALFALRFKAIPDYDVKKGREGEPFPFEKFAILCIRRHISTVLKSSFQNKKKALNTSISLDQDRKNSNDEDSVHLMNIFTLDNRNIIDHIGDKEYYKILVSKLFEKLSSLEKKVFVLYKEKYSYEDMTDRINKYYQDKGKTKRVKRKSIDNALSRMKIKAKQVYDKYFIYEK